MEIKAEETAKGYRIHIIVEGNYKEDLYNDIISGIEGMRKKFESHNIPLAIPNFLEINLPKKQKTVVYVHATKKKKEKK